MLQKLASDVTNRDLFEIEPVVKYISSDLVWNNKRRRKIREPDNGKYYPYDISRKNWHGRRNTIEQLITTSQWSNVHLSNTERKIVNEYNKLVLNMVILFSKFLVILTMPHDF